MRSRSAQSESKSLKTFFVYTAIVLFFILLSLSIRGFYLLQQSRFDGKNQMIIAFGKDETVSEIAAFRPSERAVTVVTLKGEDVSFSTLGKKLGIIPTAVVKTKGNVPLDTDISDTMRELLLHYYTVKTNLTILDATQLFFVSRKPTLNNRDVREMTVSTDNEKNNKFVADLFTDDTIFSENVSIQVVNASGESGMGKRLERGITNLGGNVVSISTSRNPDKSSKIQYFGQETYTLATLKKVLGFPVEKLEKEAIADIIITIGEDQKNSSIF
jgi:hypothetical protein